jgi:restriction system protein
MGIPSYQEIMLPLLKLVGDRQEHYMRDVIEILAEQFDLTPEERQTLLPSGKQLVFENRVGWARTYMKKAGLLESTRRGYIRITDRGIEVLKQKPTRIDVQFLSQYKEFREFKFGQETNQEIVVDFPKEINETPEEILATTYEELKLELASELLDQIQKTSPEFFERLVVELLVTMGYGGTFKEAARAVGRTGDGGIDGIINEDRLGLDVIYIQAKRWRDSVGRPELQRFVGALDGKRAQKGVFITTSSFTNEAREYISNVQKKIVLIDGQMLVDFMIEYNVGVSTTMTYQIKKVEYDYFAEE